MESIGNRAEGLPRVKKPFLCLSYVCPVPSPVQCRAQGMQGAPSGALSQELSVTW